MILGEIIYDDIIILKVPWNIGPDPNPFILFKACKLYFLGFPRPCLQA
jgi:hypothetical protein